MRQIAVICAVFAVMFLAFFGVLMIFGIVTPDFASSTLAKAVAAVVLLGVCTAVIAVLLGWRK